MQIIGIENPFCAAAQFLWVIISMVSFTIAERVHILWLNSKKDKKHPLKKKIIMFSSTQENGLTRKVGQ